MPNRWRSRNGAASIYGYVGDGERADKLSRGGPRQRQMARDAPDGRAALGEDPKVEPHVDPERTRLLPL
jgi:hypothetical protein